MFKSISIQNFRGFRDLTIKPLERVNIIAGKNNVGKTALLEAIYLLLSPNLPGVYSLPASTGIANLLRGFEDLNISSLDKWSWLFHNEQIRNTILISSCDDSNFKRTLQIHFEQIDEAWMELTRNLRLKVPPTKAFHMRLKYSDDTGIDSYSQFILGTGNSFTRGTLPAFPINIIPSAFKYYPKENATHFSGLVATGKQGLVLNALQLMEPRLHNLVVLILTDIPMVYGELESGELIPVAQMGEGIGRIFTILLQIADAEDGIVLIDEIENGLHYSVLTDVWRVIAEAARRSNVQIFATTHSWECIRAAHEAFVQSNVYDMRLHRLDRVNGDVEAVTYNQETLETSVEMGLEVR